MDNNGGGDQWTLEITAEVDQGVFLGVRVLDSSQEERADMILATPADIEGFFAAVEQVKAEYQELLAEGS